MRFYWMLQIQRILNPCKSKQNISFSHTETIIPTENTYVMTVKSYEQKEDLIISIQTNYITACKIHPLLL